MLIDDVVEVGSNGRPMLECHCCREVFEEGYVCSCEPVDRRWYYVFKEYGILTQQ